MTPEILRLTKRYSRAAAVTSFLVQPIPGVDELAVVPIQYLLVVRLARAKGIGLLQAPWKPAQKVIWTGAAARVAVNLTIGLVPVAGAFANAATAFALTRTLGGYVDASLDHPESPPPDITFQALKTEMLDAARQAGSRWPELTSKLRGALDRLTQRALGALGKRRGVAPAPAA